MSRVKAQKPKFNYINRDTIAEQIDNVVISFFTSRGIDIYDNAAVKTVNHNMLSLCMREVYNTLFKPSHGLYNNQRSLIDYDDVELLQIIADKFIDWSLWFNKSMGLMQFSFMSGIYHTTLALWRDSPESNPERSKVVKNICECHKMEQINILNESPVGALAVANNDNETGLNWSRQQAMEQANNAVYLIPSERLNKLGIDKSTQETTASVTQV